MAIFFAAMVLNPEVQQKAQAQIQAVIGSERLPSFDDMANLPYIVAIVKECLRWQPVVALGIFASRCIFITLLNHSRSLAAYDWRRRYL